MRNNLPLRWGNSASSLLRIEELILFSLYNRGRDLSGENEANKLYLRLSLEEKMIMRQPSKLACWVVACAVGVLLLMLSPVTIAVASVQPRAQYETIDAPGAGSASGQGTILQGIDANGEVVGIYEDAGNLDHGFTDLAGTFTTIDDPFADTGTVTPPNTGQGTNAYAITRGTVVGDYIGPSGTFRGFVERDGQFSALDDPNAGMAPGQGTMPFSISSSGEIVGTYIDASNIEHGFFVTHGTFQAFNDPNAGNTGGQGTALTFVNNPGVLVGDYVDPSGTVHGFSYRSGHYQEYDDPNAGSGETFPLAINNEGTVVGDYFDTGGALNGFVDTAGTYRTIDDPAGAGGTAVADVNEAGLMDGYYIDAQGVFHGFIYGAAGRIKPTPDKGAT